MKTGYVVGDCMTHRPIHISPDTTLAECAMLMKSKRIGSLLVKQGNDLKGIVTEQDLVRKAVASNTTPGNMTAAEVMVQDVITIAPEKDVFDALFEMREYDIRHLPVMEEKKCIGLITMKDILKIQPQLFEILVEKIRLREDDRKPSRKV